jgi:diacylglycerol kinase (ATP)
MMRAAIIVNPIAGEGKAKQMAPRAKEKLEGAGFEVEVMESAFAGASTGLAREAAQKGSDRVIACGGDGTVLEVVNGLDGTACLMGILPFGRGNDVYKDLGLPPELESAFQTVSNGSPRFVDAVKCRGRAFLGVGGVGIDAQAAVNADRWKRFLPKSSISYILVGFWTLIFFQPFTLDMTLDGESYHFQKTYVVAVGNTSTYSQGMRILPKASPSDGLLDACVITSSRHFHVLPLFFKIFSGDHLKDPGVHYFQGKELQLNCPDFQRKIYCFADGELFGILPNHFSASPRQVQLLYPKDPA